MTSAPVQVGTTVFEYDSDTEQYVEWYVVDLQWRDDGVSAILTHGDRRATVDADELGDAVTDRDTATWVPSMYDGEADDGTARWIPDPRFTDDELDDSDLDLRVGPDSPTELDFERVGGAGSRIMVNHFLNGSDDDLVAHELGGVSSWKTAFVARHDGAIVSALVVHAYHPSQNGTDAVITRIANHPCAPANTSSWMIARAREWARDFGYERMVSYAGVGGNGGTCYRAAGFDAVGEPERVTGKSWVDSDGEEWVKQKYVYEFDTRDTPGAVESAVVGSAVESTISAARSVAGVDELDAKTVGGAVAASI